MSLQSTKSTFKTFRTQCSIQEHNLALANCPRCNIFKKCLQYSASVVL